MNRRHSVNGTAALCAAWLMFATTCLASEEAAAPKDEVGKKIVLYDDAIGARMEPSGWMPDNRGLALDTKAKDEPYSGKFCMKCTFIPEKQPEGWGGIAHLYLGRWRGPKLDVAKAIEAQKGDPVVMRFWVRSPTKSTVKFEFGGGDGDSMAVAESTGFVELTPTWKRYEIDLTDQDLSKIGKGFTWVIDSALNDDIRVHEFYVDRAYISRIDRKPLR